MNLVEIKRPANPPSNRQSTEPYLDRPNSDRREQAVHAFLNVLKSKIKQDLHTIWKCKCWFYPSDMVATGREANPGGGCLLLLPPSSVLLVSCL
jgi:hypothetical protein